MGHVNSTVPTGAPRGPQAPACRVRTPADPGHEPAACIRQEIVGRLRLQLATGDYDPPVDELVDRLVSLIIARQTARLSRPGE